MSSASVRRPLASVPAGCRLSFTCAIGAFATGRGRARRAGGGATDSWTSATTSNAAGAEKIIVVSLGYVPTLGRWLYSRLLRLPADFFSPVLDHDDLTTLRAVRALHHEKTLAIRRDVVVAPRSRR